MSPTRQRQQQSGRLPGERLVTADNVRMTPDRRTQVLEAAQCCFRTEGFHGASMSRIASAAGMSVGQIYRYFDSKEAIIAEFVARDLEASVLGLSALPAAPEGQFETMLEVARERAAPEAMALWLEVLAEAARNPRVAAMVRDADAQLRARIAETLSRPPVGPLDRAEAFARAELICTLFEGSLVRSVHSGCGEPMRLPVLRELLMWALNGCTGDPRARACPMEQRAAPPA